LGNYILEQTWVLKGMVDFAVAGKKGPGHISMYARLSIVETNAILYGTHLTTALMLVLKVLFLIEGVLMLYLYLRKCQ